VANSSEYGNETWFYISWRENIWVAERLLASQVSRLYKSIAKITVFYILIFTFLHKQEDQF
jgi:hypothetical protein